ncbi:MAG TPA: type II toxin-antitoxin system VapC family toxin [Stellaceae bacterium]|nr:type II toxin-antitoxin system VapC family toxin [Stellaceae bacterium]
MTFVLDSSVAVAWCFEDEQTPALLALLQRTTDTGAFAPALWPLEAANALLVAERRRRLGRDRRRRLCNFLKALPIALDADTATQAWTATAGLAERFGLSAYDAAYLELAERLDLPLASLDGDLRRAADTLGLPLLGSA